MISYLIIILIFLIFGITFYAWVLGVPTVYTPKKAVSLMVREANLKDGQIIYDLGAGNGRILFEAAKKKKVFALGYELFWPVYFWTKVKNLFISKKGKVKILFSDFWLADFKNVNVIFCFLMPKAMQKVGEKFKKEVKRDAKLISYCFKVDNLKPQKVIKLEGIAPIYVYVKK